MDPKHTGLVALDVLRYFYYGGKAPSSLLSSSSSSSYCAYLCICRFSPSHPFTHPPTHPPPPGLIYLGLQRYTDARDFFKATLSTPAQSLSLPAIEAYKKLLLITALLPSSPTPSSSSSSSSSSPSSSSSSSTSLPTLAANQSRLLLPKHTPNVVFRHIRTHALPYHELLTAAQAGTSHPPTHLPV